MNKIVSSMGLFIVAGLCEIGGGWLVWQSIRSGRPFWWGVMGGIVLILYGIVPIVFGWGWHLKVAIGELLLSLEWCLMDLGKGFN